MVIENDKYILKLPIGDWSDDGHGKCDWFDIESNKPVNDVFNAYFDAAEKHMDIEPGNMCEQYECRSFGIDILDKMCKLGFDKEQLTETDSNAFCVCPSPKDFAKIVIWFIQLGDADLKLSLMDETEGDKLINWNCEDGDFPSFGYGLFY